MKKFNKSIIKLVIYIIIKHKKQLSSANLECKSIIFAYLCERNKTRRL